MNRAGDVAGGQSLAGLGRVQWVVVAPSAQGSSTPSPRWALFQRGDGTWAWKPSPAPIEP
jgi:hypothetical protein